VANATPRSSDKETWECRFFFPQELFQFPGKLQYRLADGRFLDPDPCQLAGAWMPVRAPWRTLLGGEALGEVGRQAVVL